GTWEISAELEGLGRTTRTIEVAESGSTVDLGLRPTVAETIAVTARKREENLRDVPFAISTVTSRDIEEKAIQGFIDLLESLPNVHVSSINSSCHSCPINIRGFESENQMGFEPAVGLYIDEVYVPRTIAVEKLLIDVERAEVARGPQGTSWGKNTIGGAINLVTSKPGAVEHGTLELSSGNFGLRQVRGFYGGPLGSEKVAGKISFGKLERDGWIENRTPGLDDVMDEDTVAGRGQLAFQPSDGASILVSADYSQNDDVQSVEDIHSGPLFEGGFDRSIASNEAQFQDRESLGGHVRGDFVLGDHVLTTITGYRDLDWIDFEDNDNTFLSIQNFVQSEQLEYLSQEVRVASASGGEFSWLAGVFLSDREDTFLIDAVILEDLLPLFGLPAFPGFVERVVTLPMLDEQSRAAFFSGSWAFADRASLEFGVRVSDEEKDMFYRQDVFPQIGLIYAFAAPVAPTTQSLSETEPTGDVSLIYALNDTDNVYARLAHGFKSGGFSAGLAATPNAANLAFDKETVDALEVGYKALLANRKIRLNVAAFYQDLKDKQEEFFNGIHFFVNNAAEASSTGAELELAASPASGLELFLNVGHLSGKYDSFVDEQLGQDFSGNRLARAPKWTSSIGASYYRPLSESSGWFIRSEYNYRDDFCSEATNDPLLCQSDTQFLHARTGVDLMDDKLTVAVWVRNLTDQLYDLGSYQLFGNRYGRPSIPRTYGVEVRLRR
ncbi:MAG: TonB-dependent receptor, partial [Acidobacteriota bacterium]|nr:TonB-dependent receptor [Acidobacteriota bacterium]